VITFRQPDFEKGVDFREVCRGFQFSLSQKRAQRPVESFYFAFGEAR
jgi:hypothetical protein